MHFLSATLRPPSKCSGDSSFRIVYLQYLSLALARRSAIPFATSAVAEKIFGLLFHFAEVARAGEKEE
jgi:hypothetical protein